MRSYVGACTANRYLDAGVGGVVEHLDDDPVGWPGQAACRPDGELVHLHQAIKIDKDSSNILLIDRVGRVWESSECSIEIEVVHCREREYCRETVVEYCIERERGVGRGGGSFKSKVAQHPVPVGVRTSFSLYMGIWTSTTG